MKQLKTGLRMDRGVGFEPRYSYIGMGFYTLDPEADFKESLTKILTTVAEYVIKQGYVKAEDKGSITLKWEVVDQ